MPANISRETRIFLALWRKAVQQGKDKLLPAVTFASKSDALAARMAMYRALAPYREGTDYELIEAGENFTVSVVDRVLSIVPKRSAHLAFNMLNNLGLKEDELLLPDERKLLDRAANLVNPPSTIPDSLIADDPFDLKGS